MEAIDHLGEILEWLSNLHPGDRTTAFNDALQFYNKNRGDRYEVSYNHEWGPLYLINDKEHLTPEGYWMYHWYEERMSQDGRNIFEGI